jgi:hypothetical protein
MADEANVHPTLNDVGNGLAEMESAFYRVRNLAYAARMLGSADEMPREPGGALDAIADLIVGTMDELNSERHRLWLLTLGNNEASGRHVTSR